MRRIGLVLLASVPIVLTACVNNNPKQVNCHRIHWQRVGEKEGVQGKQHQNLSELFPMCGSDISINKTAYDRGWSHGIVQFCRPENGYKLGVEGKNFPNFCPPDLNQAFRHAYQRGTLHYQEAAIIKSKLDAVTAELNMLQKRQAQQQEFLTALKDAYANQPFSPEQQYRIRKLNLGLDRLAKKERTLNQDKAHLTVQYDALLKYPE